MGTSNAVGRAFADAEDDAYRLPDRYRIETIAYKLHDRAKAMPAGDDREAAMAEARNLSRLDHYLAQADKRHEAVRILLEGEFEIPGYAEAVGRAMEDLNQAYSLLETEIAKVRNRLWQAVPEEEKAERIANLRLRSETVRATPPRMSDMDIDWDALRAAELLELRESGYGSLPANVQEA